MRRPKLSFIALSAFQFPKSAMFPNAYTLVPNIVFPLSQINLTDVPPGQRLRQHKQDEQGCQGFSHFLHNVTSIIDSEELLGNIILQGEDP
jgi:hypothetical protein